MFMPYPFQASDGSINSNGTKYHLLADSYHNDKLAYCSSVQELSREEPCNLVSNPGLPKIAPIFLHGYEIKSGRGRPGFKATPNSGVPLADHYRL